MRRRSRVGGEPQKTRRRKATTLKRCIGPKSGRRPLISKQSLAQLTRELNEAVRRRPRCCESSVTRHSICRSCTPSFRNRRTTVPREQREHYHRKGESFDLLGALN
jgi:hypothetical protein